jgi:hypothetical protein
MDTKKVEIKNFNLLWDGCKWIIHSKTPRMTEYIYLPLAQIIEMLKIENITTEEFDNQVENWEQIKFDKVTLLAEQDKDGEFLYHLMYEPADFEEEGFEMIKTEIKL